VLRKFKSKRPVDGQSQPGLRRIDISEIHRDTDAALTGGGLTEMEQRDFIKQAGLYPLAMQQFTERASRQFECSQEEGNAKI
jgi:hypothetical protein